MNWRAKLNLLADAAAGLVKRRRRPSREVESIRMSPQAAENTTPRTPRKVVNRHDAWLKDP